MKNKFTLLVPAICLVMISAFSVSAKADTLTFVYGSNTYVAYQPIGPYVVNVNGTDVAALCLNLNRVVTPGETWLATAYDWATGTNPLLTQYKEEAYLFSLLTPSNAVDVQLAAWDIFDPAGVAALGQPMAPVNSLLSAAAANIGSLPLSFFENYSIFIPDASDSEAWTQGIPQDFITSAVPEPSSLMLFGSGLVGLAGIARRKLARS